MNCVYVCMCDCIQSVRCSSEVVMLLNTSKFLVFFLFHRAWFYLYCHQLSKWTHELCKRVNAYQKQCLAIHFTYSNGTPFVCSHGLCGWPVGWSAHFEFNSLHTKIIYSQRLPIFLCKYMQNRNEKRWFILQQPIVLAKWWCPNEVKQPKNVT